MKESIIILFLIATCFKSLNAIEKNESVLDSMLQQNFKLFLIADREVDSSLYVNRKKFNKIENPQEFKYVNNTSFNTISYPPGFEFKDTMSGIKISYVDLNDYMSFKQMLKKPVGVMSLSVIIIEKNRICFNYRLGVARCSKKYQYTESIYAWFRCPYEYDCKTKRWVFLESRLR